MTKPGGLRPAVRRRELQRSFRRRVIKLLVDHKLLNENFARNLLSWKHSGFSIDNSVRILDESAQESLVEYIARPPISLKKIRYEPFKGKVLFHTKYSDYFRPTRRVSREPSTSSMRWSSWPNCSDLRSFRIRLRYATSSPTWSRQAVHHLDSIPP